MASSRRCGLRCWAEKFFTGSKYGKSALPDLVLCGNAVGPGGNIGRLTVLEAGLPEEVPAMTLDLQCASALAAIDLSAAKIASGMADFILAGGTESASLAPRRIYQEWDERSRKREPEFTAAQFRPGEFSDDAMLLGAERAAKKAGISREGRLPRAVYRASLWQYKG